MNQKNSGSGGMEVKRAPKGLGILLLLGPSFVWCAEYIGSGEVILATRTGALLGSGILWAVALGVLLKYLIGLGGARYTVCTGEGMIDMFDRMPGPGHWTVWIVLVVQTIAAVFSIASIANAAGNFVNNMIPVGPRVCGWAVSICACIVAWFGLFNMLKIIMSVFVLIILLGVLYVAFHVFPPLAELSKALGFTLPEVPDWAVIKGTSSNPWREILPLIGWGAGGFASQVWYTYWVLGAGYGAASAGREGQPADVSKLKQMTEDTARNIKGWFRVLYLDATVAMVLGIVVTSSFLIAGSGILNPKELAPEGPEVASKLSTIFSDRWGAAGGFLFMLSGAAALIATQIGQLAGWPRLLSDSFRICIPSFGRRFPWNTQRRLFLVFFFITSLVLVYSYRLKPVSLVKVGAVLDGLVLTPFQAILVIAGLFIIMPKLLSKQAGRILKAPWILGTGLMVSFVVFTYFCIFQVPYAITSKAGFYLPRNQSYTILDSARDSVNFAVSRTLVPYKGHLRCKSSFVDQNGKVMKWHDFGALEGPGWAANAVGGAYELYLFGQYTDSPSISKKGLLLLDHVLEDGFINYETGFIKGYRDTATGKLCLNYQHKNDWFCPGSMAKVAYQLLIFADLLEDPIKSKMQRVAVKTASWINTNVKSTPNGWYPRRCKPDGSHFPKNPYGDEDRLFQKSADGLFIIQLFTALTERDLASYTGKIRLKTDRFIELGGIFGSINHDTYDENENVSYAVAFRVLKKVADLLGDDEIREFAYEKCLHGLDRFKIKNDIHGVQTKGLLFMEESWDTAYLWENAEAALAYLEAYRETQTDKYLSDGLTILRAIAKHHHGEYGFLTEGVDWNNHVGAKHHFGGAEFGDIKYTEPLLNNLHIVEPTLSALKILKQEEKEGAGGTRNQKKAG